MSNIILGTAIAFLIGLNLGMFARFLYIGIKGSVPKMKNPPAPPTDCTHEWRRLINEAGHFYLKCSKCGKL